MTSGFDIQRRMIAPPQPEMFQFATQNKSAVYKQYLTFEVKKVLNQVIPKYEGENNFEIRERIQDFSSTYQVMIYPKHVIVNKTSMPLILEN